jgi:hypothetical protein
MKEIGNSVKEASSRQKSASKKTNKKKESKTGVSKQEGAMSASTSPQSTLSLSNRLQQAGAMCTEFAVVIYLNRQSIFFAAAAAGIYFYGEWLSI